MRLQHVGLTMPIGGESDARAFYGDVLGLRELEPPTAATASVWFDAGEGLELHLFAGEGNSAGARHHVCFTVDDLDALRARLQRFEIEIEKASPLPGRHRIFAVDPFGNRIELSEIEAA